ncbi:MAG: thioredoxin family protein [Thermoanaerobaculia bacterium]
MERLRPPFVGSYGSRAWLAIAAVVALCGLSADPLVGQAAGGALSGFRPVGYQFELDGETVADAAIYQSRAAGAFLILSSALPSPVLLRLREARVETVHLLKVDQKADGTIDLLPGPTLDSLGGFRVTADRRGITFDLAGRQAVMREKAPLLGAQDLEGLVSHSPDYRRTAEAYAPSGPILNKLRAEERGVKVSVYFGSWCPFCQQMVPRIMKVAEELAGSNIKVEFYGLPRAISSDREASRLGIRGVPTAVVFVDGQEVGRISGQSWKVPELAINNILVNQGS